MAFVTQANLNEDALPSIADTTPTFGEYLGAAASDAWGYNPSVALYRASNVLESQVDMDTLDIDADAMDFDPESIHRREGLSIHDQQERIDREGLKGKVQPQEGYNADTLDLIFHAKHEEIDDAMTREAAPSWMGAFGLAVGLGASFLDPINLASGFLPVVSRATQLRMLQGASGSVGRAGARALTGLAEGAAGAAMVEPVIQLARSTEQLDYQLADSLMNVAFGSIMGATMHVGKGALGEWLRTRKGMRQEWEIFVPTAESEKRRLQMADDIFMAAKEAGAEKIGRLEADAASALFDLHARQWAYDFGKTPEEFYRQYAPHWKAGVLTAAEGGDVIKMGVRAFVGGLTEENIARGDASARIVEALQEARAREAEGIAPDDIADMTGWRKAEDGMWRYEGEPDVLYEISGGKAKWGINVRNTRDAKFADLILDALKTIETRTPKAWQQMQAAGIKPGDRIAIVKNRKVLGYVTLDDVIRYDDEESFRADEARHLVKQGNRYDYDAKKGKVGLVLSNPERVVDGAQLPPLGRIQGWRELPPDMLHQGGSKYQRFVDALDMADDLLPADRNAIMSDLQSGMLAERHQAIEAAVEKVREGGMENGPDVDDVVSGPALSMRDAGTLNQWQNIPEWQERLTNWMRNDGYTEPQIAEKVAAIKGQMALYEALGAKIRTEVVGSGQAKGGDNHGVKYSGPIRSNIDEIYLISFDLSSQCVKRLAAANTAAIAEAALGRPLRVEEQMALIALERAKGQEAPCVYCYVESNRAKARQAVGRARDMLETGVIPKRWSAGRKEAAKAAIDLFRSGGLKKEDINYNYVLDQNLRNTEAVAAIRDDPRFKAIYDFFDKEANATKQNQAKPYEEYTGELLNLTPDQVQMLNGYAGMRFFSTSDFQVEHVVDVIQAMWDMNAMGLKSHGYTKVPLYVDIFGDTGQKINMSCFAKVDPSTGEIGMDEAQGWNWNLAKEYRQQHPDVGIIFVCANDKILEWALAQDWIDYCIPFHFSGLEKQYYLQLGWQDFTSTQSESNIYASKRTRASGFFEEAPEKIVTGGEQRELEAIAQENGVGEASKAYAQKCFDRRLFPVKPEAFFKPEFIEGKNKPQRARVAKELWQQIIEDESFDPEMINPDYWTEFKKKGATTKEKTLDDLSVKRVRMHEIKFTMPDAGTRQHEKLSAWAEKNGVDLTQFEAGRTYSNETGMPDWMGTFAYLELCRERKIYPVFVNFMFKDYRIATLTEKMAAAADKKTATAITKDAAKIRKQAEADLAEFMVGHPNLPKEAQAKFVENRIREAQNFMAMDNTAGKVGDVRGKHVKAAKERWEDMVMSGEIDYDAINPNAYKVKKDYARTDTPFNVPDPRKINAHAASIPLRETIDQGLAVKYHGDPEVAEQLVKLARFGEESGRNIGSASLKALRERQHPMAALLGEDASLEKNSSSLWQRKAKKKRMDQKQKKPANVDKIVEGVEDFVPVEEPEAEAKGRITFNAMEDGKAMIEFFSAADATTAPHEMYHLFRRQMAESAADPNAPQRVKDAYRQACDYVGAEPGKAWTVEQEEKFARAGEAFLMEGQAPHPAFQGVFDRMKQWFTEAYNSAEEAGLEISDSMRKVFGDMFMSPSVDEAGALYRYSMGKILDTDPADGIDTNFEISSDDMTKPEAIADMQEAADNRVRTSLESLQERLPESDVEAFRKEFDEDMRAENDAIAAVAREEELMNEAAACELRSM